MVARHIPQILHEILCVLTNSADVAELLGKQCRTLGLSDHHFTFSVVCLKFLCELSL